MSCPPDVISGCAEEQSGFFPRRPLLLSLTLAVLFVASFAVRIYRIGDPPLDFNAVRQYSHALRVRSYYYSHFDPSAPQWMRKVAESQAHTFVEMEPPFIEGMTVLLYWLTGGVRLWIPRLLSSVFWVVGGVVLYVMTKRVVSTDAAVLSTGFYLLLPYGVFASRSFTRDPLLVMLLLVSILAIVRYDEQQSMPRLVVAGILTGLALLIKPILFMLPAAFIALAIRRMGFRKSALDPRSWVFMALAIPMPALFHLYPLLFSGYTAAAVRYLRPAYLLDPFFYRAWLVHIQTAVGFGALIVALLGVFLSQAGRSRALMLGLWCGYLAFGLIITYPARTHPYYHLQLIPLVALCVGPVGALILARFDTPETRSYARVGVVGTLFLAMVLALGTAGVQIARQDYEDQVRTYEEVGDAVHHSTNTVYLTEAYGYPLEYYGWLAGKAWPCAACERAYYLPGLPDIGSQERYLAEYASASPEYFIITDFRELEEQADLRPFLTQNFPTAAETDEYLIFDLSKPINCEEETR